MIDIFKALSEETRLRILALIWNSELCVCEIEDCLDLTQSNASRHLTVLKNAGILSSSKHAQWAYYKLNEDFCKDNQELIDYLAIKLRLLPNYETDINNVQKCKGKDLCSKKNTTL